MSEANEVDALVSTPCAKERRMSIATVGHVDHGRQTVLALIQALHGFEVEKDARELVTPVFEIKAPPPMADPRVFEEKPRRKGQRRGNWWVY